MAGIAGIEATVDCLASFGSLITNESLFCRREINGSGLPEAAGLGRAEGAADVWMSLKNWGVLGGSIAMSLIVSAAPPPGVA